MKTPAFVNYKKIYEDILTRKHPEKIKECERLLNKERLSVLDVIELNGKIFGNPDRSTQVTNQRHRSYGKTDILKILDYQKKHRLNNSQLALHFKLSRNTVTKWKKQFVMRSSVLKY